MSVSVTMAFKGTVPCAMVRAQILPGQIKPRDQVQLDLKHGSSTTFKTLVIQLNTRE